MQRQNAGEQVIRVRLPRGSQLLGEILEISGASRFKILCKDGKTRLCRIPGKHRKRVNVRIGDAVLVEPWDIEPDEKGDIRTVLHLHPALAPLKVAVLPLSRKETLLPLATKVYEELRPYWAVSYDDTQSIGRRYRRQDEIGTPFCVTLDFQALEDNQVTIRDRDSMHQIRVPISQLKHTIRAKLEGEDILVLPPGGQVWKQGA